MAVVYPVLVGEIAKRGIKKTVIANRIGISTRSLYSKLAGETSFSWDEACEIRDCFFPDVNQSELFQRVDGSGT